MIQELQCTPWGQCLSAFGTVTIGRNSLENTYPTWIRQEHAFVLTACGRVFEERHECPAAICTDIAVIKWDVEYSTVKSCQTWVPG